MTVTVTLTNINTEITGSRYMYDITVNGAWVKSDTLTREGATSAEWLTNYFQKWAYRTYHVQNAKIVLSN